MTIDRSPPLFDDEEDLQDAIEMILALEDPPYDKSLMIGVLVAHVCGDENRCSSEFEMATEYCSVLEELKHLDII